MIALALCVLLAVGCHAAGPCAKARDDYQKTGMVGRILSCDADGFYSQIQCTGSVCHCSDAVGRMLGASDDVFSIGDFRDNQAKCASLAEERPCNKARADYQKKGLIGLQFRCDADGFYELIQCRGSGCYCVNLEGKVLKGGEFSISELSKPELLSQRQSSCKTLEVEDFWSSG